MVTWAEFFYSIYGLITVGVGSLLIGIIIGLNIPTGGGNEGHAE
jgi:hypothetical protein